MDIAHHPADLRSGKAATGWGEDRRGYYGRCGLHGGRSVPPKIIPESRIKRSICFQKVRAPRADNLKARNCLIRIVGRTWPFINHPCYSAHDSRRPSTTVIMIPPLMPPKSKFSGGAGRLPAGIKQHSCLIIVTTSRSFTEVATPEPRRLPNSTFCSDSWRIDLWKTAIVYAAVDGRRLGGPRRLGARNCYFPDALDFFSRHLKVAMSRPA